MLTGAGYAILRGIAVKSDHTYSLHCNSFWGLPFRILNIELVKPKKGTTMETIGNIQQVNLLGTGASS